MGTAEKFSLHPAASQVAFAISVNSATDVGTPGSGGCRMCLTNRQKQAYCLRHFDAPELTDAECAARMGLKGERAREKFNKLVRRAERKVNQILEYIKLARGDCTVLEQIIRD